jgi:hypothetical protein
MANEALLKLYKGPTNWAELTLTWRVNGGDWKKDDGDGDLGLSVFGNNSGKFEVKTWGVIWLLDQQCEVRPVADPFAPGPKATVGPCADETRVILWDTPKSFGELPSAPPTPPSGPGPDGVMVVWIPFPTPARIGKGRLYHPLISTLNDQGVNWEMTRR